MATDEIRVHETRTIGRIAPEIYGHFVEHLGRCIYNGIWVGEDADVPHTDGVRDDTVELLAALDPPVFRWPGGCFAEDYYWEDGIGPREERPRRRNLWWAQGRPGSTDVEVFEETNEFGTDEFVRTCELLGAEPYLAVNVGTGTPREAMNWVEYCNSAGDTEYTRMREENGSPEPHGVRYWGIGNETYGCGGDYEPGDYGLEYRRYATFLRGLQRAEMTDDIELVACGFTDPDWNRQFMETVGGKSIFDYVQLVDHVSVHRYVSTESDTDFSEDGYYASLAECAEIRTDIDRLTDVLDEFAPSDDIGIVIDEWGLWHPEATFENGNEQENTVRDGVIAASFLDIFNSRADRVTMANIAQTVNVLQCLVQTGEGTAWPTPTYRVFDLYKPHMGATALRTSVETAVRDVRSSENDLPYVGASASACDSELFVTLSNRHYRDSRSVRVDVGAAPADASAEVLFAEQTPREFSTAANADQFAPANLAVDVESDGVHLDVPAASVAGVRIST